MIILDKIQRDKIQSSTLSASVQQYIKGHRKMTTQVQMNISCTAWELSLEA